MIIGSIKEDINLEKRISITPDVIKKYKSIGIDVCLTKGYGNHIGIDDNIFLREAAKIFNSDIEVINNSELIVQLNILSDEKISILKSNQILIGTLNPYNNLNKLKELYSKKINCFSIELLPRITRAQSMDVLSSQANLAGYKAVVDSFSYFNKAIPMMMTAAGTISAAKVLVIGAGVAGLQAIATAKRMGAIVYATDVRSASKEQVESLGGKFLSVEDSENLETSGGYAKETSDEFKKKQHDLLKTTLEKIDIVICTALIPGKKAPIIINKDMIKVMKSGSIIYDLAAPQGGNTELTKIDEVVETNSIKILGERNILNKLPISSSNLYAKNIFNFVNNLYDSKVKNIKINLEDEIINQTLVK